MAKGDRLFDLINSLGLNEKRYFKMHSAIQKRESNLVKLFDYYTEVEEFNESEIHKRFKGEKFLSQLSVTQNHLYETLLRSMRMYHLKKSIDFRLHGMLQDVQFLYEKGLVDQASELLRRVKKVATKNDRFLILLDAIEWESKFLSESFFVNKDEFDIDQMSEEYYEVLGALQNQREYTDLQSKIFNNYYKIGIERNNADYKTNDQIINQFALRDPKRALTFMSKCCYLNIHAQYNKINGNWEEAYRYRMELLDLVEERFGTSFGNEVVKRYFVALNNLIPICMKLKKFDEVATLLDKMESIEQKSLKSMFSLELENRIMLQSSIGRLALYTRLGKTTDGLAIVNWIKQSITEIDMYHRKYVVLHLYFNMAYFLFSIDEHSEALRWVNLIINDTDIKSVEDLHASTRLLILILQFELGRSEFLEYLARTTHRYLDKLEGVYEFERIVLVFMKEYSKRDILRNQKEVFTKLRDDLLSVAYEPGERNALSTLDLISWCESKMQNKPMGEILRIKNEG